MLIALLPCDTTDLPLPAGVTMPTPSVEHTLTKCDICGRDCWIGPSQKIAKDHRVLPAFCYFCLFQVMKEQGGVYDVIGLDPAADDKPRRLP